MSDEQVLREATFSPHAPKYYTVQSTIVFSVVMLAICIPLAFVTLGISLIGLLIPLVLIGSTKWYYNKYYAHLSCTLTDRKLLIGRGVWNRVEQAVPLDKITDMQMNQGIVMRWLDLESMKVETAGQTSGAGGALVGIVGIEDSRGFRAAVLAQRDKVVGSSSGAGSSTLPMPVPGGATETSDALLADIRDTLNRIESHLASNGS